MLLSIAFTALTNAAPPDSVKIMFEVKMGELKIGQGIDTLQHDSQSYILTSKIIPRGLASLFQESVRSQI